MPENLKYSKEQIISAMHRITNMPLGREGTIAGDRDADAIDIVCYVLQRYMASEQ